MSTEEQDLLLARLVRELKEKERLYSALRASILEQLRGLREVEVGILPAVNGQRMDVSDIQRARKLADGLPDRPVVIDDLRQMEETLTRIAQVKESIDGMTK